MSNLPLFFTFPVFLSEQFAFIFHFFSNFNFSLFHNSRIKNRKKSVQKTRHFFLQRRKFTFSPLTSWNPPPWYLWYFFSPLISRCFLGQPRRPRRPRQRLPKNVIYPQWEIGKIIAPPPPPQIWHLIAPPLIAPWMLP